ncbi:MAG: hypothetical protein GX769_04240 [Erysipelothrix sp.]|nr:hypothetical protein [Erysipelothrix sp.]
MSKINTKIYNTMKDNYGICSSWAVWNDSEDGSHRFDLNDKGYKINTIVKTFNEKMNDKIINKLGLHNDVVIVALNFGLRDENRVSQFKGINSVLPNYDFLIFHEELDVTKGLHRFSGDSRQKLAYKNTPLWGAYMTDLIKFNRDGKVEPVADSDSDSNNLNDLMSDVDFMNIQVKGLINELKLLESINPTIVAVGGAAFSQLNKKVVKDKLKKELGPNTNILKIDHYSRSNTVSDAVYVEKIKAVTNLIK